MVSYIVENLNSLYSKHQNDLENQLICPAIQWNFCSFKRTKMCIGNRKIISSKNFTNFQIYTLGKLLYISFPSVPICLGLINAQALSCSHIFHSCLLRDPENVSEFKLVSSCLNFQIQTSRQKKLASLKSVVMDFLVIFQCKKFTFCFVFFCITNGSCFIDH